MKNLHASLLFTFSVVSVAFAQQFETINIGDTCPGLLLEMESVDGVSHNLQSHFNKNGLLVIFTCNTCPFVVAWEDRYKIIEEICQESNIDMLYVNSNHKKRADDDSFEAMKMHAKTMDYQFPYLLDEQSQLANIFGAKTTPHIFLFNSQKELVYVGAIDDNYESLDKVNQFYLKDAIESLVDGEMIQINKTKAIGCSIKRYTP